VIRFIELINQTTFNPRMERTAIPRFTVGEVWINPKYVVSVREAPTYKSMLQEGHLPAELNEGHTFTRVTLTQAGQSQTHVVVGSPRTVATRLGTGNPGLLKG
jgi:hypothetical protein